MKMAGASLSAERRHTSKPSFVLASRTCSDRLSYIEENDTCTPHIHTDIHIVRMSRPCCVRTFQPPQTSPSRTLFRLLRATTDIALLGPLVFVVPFCSPLAPDRLRTSFGCAFGTGGCDEQYSSLGITTVLFDQSGIVVATVQI